MLRPGILLAPRSDLASQRTGTLSARLSPDGSPHSSARFATWPNGKLPRPDLHRLDIVRLQAARPSEYPTAGSRRCPDAGHPSAPCSCIGGVFYTPSDCRSRERTGQIRQNYPLEAIASVTHSAVVTTLRMSDAILLTRRVRLTWPDLAYDQLPTDGYRRLVPPAITKGCGDVYVLIGSAKGLFGHYSDARIHCKALGPMRVGTDPT